MFQIIRRKNTSLTFDLRPSAAIHPARVIRNTRMAMATNPTAIQKS